MDVYGSESIPQRNSYNQHIQQINQAAQSFNNQLADELDVLKQEQEQTKTEKRATKMYKGAQAGNAIRTGFRQLNLARLEAHKTYINEMLDDDFLASYMEWPSKMRADGTFEEAARTPEEMRGWINAAPYEELSKPITKGGIGLKIKPQAEYKVFNRMLVRDAEGDPLGVGARSEEMTEWLTHGMESGVQTTEEARAARGGGFPEEAMITARRVREARGGVAAGATPISELVERDLAARGGVTLDPVRLSRSFSQGFPMVRGSGGVRATARTPTGPEPEPEPEENWGPEPEPEPEQLTEAERQAEWAEDAAREEEADKAMRAAYVETGALRGLRGATRGERAGQGAGALRRAAASDAREARLATERAAQAEAAEAEGRMARGSTAAEHFGGGAGGRGWLHEGQRARGGARAAADETLLAEDAAGGARSWSQTDRPVARAGETVGETASRVGRNIAAAPTTAFRGARSYLGSIPARVVEAGAMKSLQGAAAAAGGGYDAYQDIQRLASGKTGVEALGDNWAEQVGNVLNIGGSALEVGGMLGWWTPVGAATELVGAITALTGTALEAAGELYEGDEQDQKDINVLTQQQQAPTMTQQTTTVAGKTK